MTISVPLLLLSVPVGAENARGAKEIWHTLDCWSPITIRNHLNDLASSGRIQRRLIPCSGGTHRWNYWREPLTALEP